jgi:hypothetical protein
MYAYPGNAAISGKPESYKDVCTWHVTVVCAVRI